MKNKKMLISSIIVSILIIGCAKKDPYLEVNKQLINYDISRVYYKTTGENHFIINEFINGQKTRIVKELVISDNELPKRIDFDGCESIQKIRVIENTQNGFIDKEEINGKDYYLKSDCISTLNFSKDINNVNIEGVINTIAMMQYSKTNLKPYIPLIRKTPIKKFHFK
ncbi:hypothetical protein D3M61_04755 [Aliarcobacter butzleri]|uniref:hypothetical protein n=1 Tax=Aliarcobacter butzleri TaxID=28197 RepID=UPI00102DAFA6|nr:hypothetical protein [Aliarcobacter butzleri]RZV14553.1 hypothetical protein D3M61_04755 [Aliarcobacter butzleri]